MDKKKIFKKIVFILLIIVLIVLLDVTRKYLIINSIMAKSEKCSSETNYHITRYLYSVNSYSVSSGYTKDNRSIIKRTMTTDNSVKQELVMSVKDNDMTMYIDAGENKVAIVGKNNAMVSALDESDIFKELSFWERVYTAFSSSITSKVVNGKDCYKLTPILPNSQIFGLTLMDVLKLENHIYFDKETGLRVKLEYSSVIYELGEDGNQKECQINEVEDTFYEFGTVKDENLIEPDISQYVIQESK